MGGTTFECAVMTYDGEIASGIMEHFNKGFENSVIFRM